MRSGEATYVLLAVSGKGGERKEGWQRRRKDREVEQKQKEFDEREMHEKTRRRRHSM